jgi:hypothetical protein
MNGHLVFSESKLRLTLNSQYPKDILHAVIPGIRFLLHEEQFCQIRTSGLVLSFSIECTVGRQKSKGHTPFLIAKADDEQSHELPVLGLWFHNRQG